MAIVNQNVTITPASTQRLIVLTFNGVECDRYEAAEIETAKSKARKLRDIDAGKVKLTWQTTERPAHVMTPLAYAHWMEGLGEDEATEPEYRENCRRYGDPDTELSDLHYQACRRAGLSFGSIWPAHLDARDYGAVSRDAFSYEV